MDGNDQPLSVHCFPHHFSVGFPPQCKTEDPIRCEEQRHCLSCLSSRRTASSSSSAEPSGRTERSRCRAEERRLSSPPWHKQAVGDPPPTAWSFASKPGVLLVQGQMLMEARNLSPSSFREWIHGGFLHQKTCGSGTKKITQHIPGLADPEKHPRSAESPGKFLYSILHTRFQSRG